MVDYDLIDEINDPDKVLTLIRKFIELHQIVAPEAIYQHDVVLAAIPDFVAEICDASGYFIKEDEEEDIFNEGDIDNPYYDD